MKQKLKEKLIELGYAQSYIEEKIIEWNDVLKDKKPWEIEEDDIIIESYSQPTENVPKFFLNVNKLYEKILLFDGDVHIVYKENILNDRLQFADYVVGNKVCLLRTIEESKN